MATAMFSAKPIPTNPPVATVSPSRINRTASAGLTILLRLPACGGVAGSDWGMSDFLGLVVWYSNFPGGGLTRNDAAQQTTVRTDGAHRTEVLNKLGGG